MPKVKCTISEVIPLKKHKQNPIIAHFQNGKVSNEFASEMDVFKGADTQQDGAADILVAVSKNNVYDGYIGQDYPTDLKRTFIAIRKKHSDEVKLVEVNECNMLSYHYNNCGKKKTQNAVEFSRMSTESARRILFKDFGGKKAMKALERKEKMKINVDVVKDQLDKTLLDINQSVIERHDVFDQSKEQQDQLLEDMVPKMNKEATRLVDVYNLNELIDADVLEHLGNEAIVVLKSPPDALPLKQKFLCTHVQAIQRSKNPDSADNLLKVKVCIYIDALINYFKQVNRVRINGNVRLDSISNVTPKLTDHMTKKFSQPNSRKLTKTNYVVHKATCYIIVLSLLISERYEMDIQNIVEEIGISKTNLFRIIGSIAVRPKAKSSVVNIRLPAQLKSFSQPFNRRRTL